MGQKQSRPGATPEADDSEDVTIEDTSPIDGQKPGTSGLRKKTKVCFICMVSDPISFREVKHGSSGDNCNCLKNYFSRSPLLHITSVNAGSSSNCLKLQVQVFEEDNGRYLANFVQAVFDALGPEVQGCTLVLGGDGRYFNDTATQIIARIAIGNGVSKLLIGKDGFLSTPAASAVIRARGCYGALHSSPCPAVVVAAVLCPQGNLGARWKANCTLNHVLSFPQCRRWVHHVCKP